MIRLHIDVTETEWAELLELAQEYGFESPEAYLKALALQPSHEELLDDIRQGILDARQGVPMMTWDELVAELD